MRNSKLVYCASHNSGTTGMKCKGFRSKSKWHYQHIEINICLTYNPFGMTSFLWHLMTEHPLFIFFFLCVVVDFSNYALLSFNKVQFVCLFVCLCVCYTNTQFLTDLDRSCYEASWGVLYRDLGYFFWLASRLCSMQLLIWEERTAHVGQAVIGSCLFYLDVAGQFQLSKMVAQLS